MRDEITALEKQLESIDAKEVTCEMTDWSLNYLQAKLFERYKKEQKRVVFTEEDLWKKSSDVVKE